jgi:hypothetical protein
MALDQRWLDHFEKPCSTPAREILLVGFDEAEPHQRRELPYDEGHEAATASCPSDSARMLT